VDAADLLVLWGADPERGARSLREAVSRARDRGAPLVVVDPRVTGVARAANVHIALRPGTDVALAAAVVQGLVEGEPPQWTRPWPVARAAPLCGCEEAVMERAAGMLAGARHPLVVAGGGLAWHGDPARSVAALGRLAEESGGKLLLPDAAPDPAGALEAPLEAPAPREVLTLDDPAGDGTGPEGAMVVVEGAVDLETRPAGLGLAEWLAGADRVLALADRWGSTARAADLVLPTPACCEHIGVVGLRHPAERWLSDRAVPRPRDLPDPWQMWRSIARRLGWPDRWFELDESALRAGVEGPPAEGRAAITGARAAGGRGAPEPLTAASPVHEELGEGPRATPMIAETYPLQAVVGELPSWVEAERDAAAREWADGAVAMLGPEEAQQRGVRSGDPVVVFNGRGSLEARLLVVQNAARRVVGLPREAAGLLSGRAGGKLSGGGLVEVAPADS
jgi:anaerobic selenocysteine-containing dehydrogenase